MYKDTAEAVDYILRGWPIRPELRKVDKAYEFSQAPTPVPARVPNVIDKINALDNKIEHPESLKFSFSRQKYVEEVKNSKNILVRSI